MIVFHLKPLKFIIIISSTLILSYSPCHADENTSSGWQCSPAYNSSTVSTSFQINLNNIFNSLSANGPLHNGFYKTTSGKKTEKIYGLIQCRGDIAANDCTKCANESINIALHNCTNSKAAAIWFRWCFLRYSNENFFGTWEGISVAITNDTDFDDPSVFSKGVAFMGRLASTAPNQPLMFQASVLDVRPRGQRFGMAQCHRDLSRHECGKCLDAQLVSLGPTVENKRGWEIYSSGCGLWYDNFQFYSNITTTSGAGANRPWCGGLIVGLTTFVCLVLI